MSGATATLPALAPRLLYSAAEAARQLCISLRTLWRYVRSGELATVALGGRRFIRHEDLVKFIDSHLDTSGAPLHPAPAALLEKNRASRIRTRKRRSERR